MKANNISGPYALVLEAVNRKAAETHSLFYGRSISARALRKNGADVKKLLNGAEKECATAGDAALSLYNLKKGSVYEKKSGNSYYRITGTRLTFFRISGTFLKDLISWETVGLILNNFDRS